MMRTAVLVLLCLATGALAGVAHAAQPQMWEVTMQPPASGVAQSVKAFADYTLVIVGAIVVLVMALILWCMVRYNSRSNPSPSRTSHNTVIEVLWTVVPVLILVAIAVPSFQLLFYQETIPPADLTVKATGHQWYWSYSYPDGGPEGVELTSVMLEDEQRTAAMDKYGLTAHELPRLLAVDFPMVVPAGKVVRVQVTGGDVIHSFALPAFGLKIDAVPGRLNETWFNVLHEGIYFGQCSELCGTRHAFMPIMIVALGDERFADWSKAAKESIDKANDMVFGWLAEDRGGNKVARLAPAAPDAN